MIFIKWKKKKMSKKKNKKSAAGVVLRYSSGKPVDVVFFFKQHVLDDPCCGDFV